MNKLLLIAGLALLAAFASSMKAGAAVIFQDNFNGYTVTGTTGVILPTGTTTAGWTIASNNTGNSTKVFKDTGDIFGSGTSNQYLQINRTGTSNNLTVSVLTQQKTGLTLGLTGQYSFTFVPDSSLGTSTTGGYQVRLAGSGGVNSTSATAYGLAFTSDGFYFAQGSSLSTYTLLSSVTAGMAYNLSVVYNFNTSTVLNYAGGSVAAGSMDVWLDTGSGYNLVGNDLLHQGGLAVGTTLETFGFVNRTQAGTLGILSVDNVLVDSLATIPEPSTVGSLSLGLTGLYVLWARRKKHSNVN